MIQTETRSVKTQSIRDLWDSIKQSSKQVLEIRAGNERERGREKCSWT